MTLFHIANGHATTRLFEPAGIAGATSVWADPLHAGPVPAGLDDAALRLVRARFLVDRGYASSVADVAAALAADAAALTQAADSDELVLWFEHDLFDQLCLIQLLERLTRLPRLPPVVSLICVDRFPGHPRFKGLGELSPPEIATLLPTRRPVRKEQYALATRAWAAFRSPEPREIESLLASDLTVLPFLAAALRRHLEEFPWTTDGLSRSERRLLELAAGGPVDWRAVFPRMHGGETAFYIGDLSYFDLADALAALTPPLLTIGTDGGMVITAEGSAVLACARDRIALSGIDWWLGGVHMKREPGARNPEPLWRWDPLEKRLKLR
jgi:hypothetical protein